MKALIVMISATLLMVSLNTVAQKMPQDYFDEGIQFVEDEDQASALKAFQYIVDNNPKNRLFPRALYNTGIINSQMGNTGKAISIFEKILKSNVNDMEPSGGGIMDDPYAGYKHNSSSMLSSIYSDIKMYDSALYYLTMSDTLYPYQHFCGNEYAADDVNKALRYGYLYLQKGDTAKAIESLMGGAFRDGLTDNSEVMEKLKEILSNKKNVAKEFEASLDKIYTEKKILNKNSFDPGREATYYYFDFLGAKIFVTWILTEKEPGEKQRKFDEKEERKQFLDSRFYKMLKDL